MKTDITECSGHLEDLDRSFDIAFWQAQPAAAKFTLNYVIRCMFRRVQQSHGGECE